MYSLFAVCVLLAMAGHSLAQSNECECSLQLEFIIFPPVLTGPIYEFPSSELSGECGERDTIRCDYSCANLAKNFIQGTDFTSPKPDDASGRSWGRYLCDVSRAAGGVTDEAISADIEAHNRVCSDEDFEWTLLFNTGKRLCCDQLGAYVDC